VTVLGIVVGTVVVAGSAVRTCAAGMDTGSWIGGCNGACTSALVAALDGCATEGPAQHSRHTVRHIL
jgi:hypothetical protein